MLCKFVFGWLSAGETRRLHAAENFAGGGGGSLGLAEACAGAVHQWVHRLQLPQTPLQVLQSPQAPPLVWPPGFVCTRARSTETRGAAFSAMPRNVVWCI